MFLKFADTWAFILLNTWERYPISSSLKMVTSGVSYWPPATFLASSTSRSMGAQMERIIRREHMVSRMAENTRISTRMTKEHTLMDMTSGYSRTALSVWSRRSWSERKSIPSFPWTIWA